MDRFTAALNSHDLDATMALVTDDIIFESTSPAPDGTRYEGRDAVRQVWGELLATTPLYSEVLAQAEADEQAELALVDEEFHAGTEHAGAAADGRSS